MNGGNGGNRHLEVVTRRRPREHATVRPEVIKILPTTIEDVYRTG